MSEQTIMEYFKQSDELFTALTPVLDESPIEIVFMDYPQ